MLEKGSGKLHILASSYPFDQKNQYFICPIIKGKSHFMVCIISVLFSVSDGTVAAAPGKQKELWQLRERIAEALLKVLVLDI